MQPSESLPEAKTASSELSFPKEIESDATSEIEKEIRSGRKFSIAEAIGREGGGFMKGESAIPRPLKAANEVKQFITTYSGKSTGVLADELYAWTIADIRFGAQLDTPLVAIALTVNSLLKESAMFYEFARQVAIAQAKLTGDRPYFQQPGRLPHPESDYPHHAIRQYLLDISTALCSADVSP